MIGLFAALLVSMDQSSAVSAPGTVTVVSEPLDIPDEIASAVIPYMACLTASKGSPLRNGPGGPEALPGRYKIGEDCSHARVEAAKNADRLLKGKKPKKQRAELIESTLASIDRFLGSLPTLAR